jgi:Phospholipase_D-nuclease N-terminal/Short C-terminal domain
VRATLSRPSARQILSINPPEGDDVLLAADYPFLNILWSMIIFFCWVAWIWVLILVLSDVFRRDISGWAKAAWVVALIVLPFLGTLIYLIAHGKDMTERRVRDVQVSQAQFDDHIRSVASNGGAAGEIAKAKQLLDSGAINQQEFDTLKAKALA